MEGRCGFSEGFPEGKSEGWNGARDPRRRRGAKPHSIPKTFPKEIPRKTNLSEDGARCPEVCELGGNQEIPTKDHFTVS